jgi:hypothetical protein
MQAHHRLPPAHVVMVTLVAAALAILVSLSVTGALRDGGIHLSSSGATPSRAAEAPLASASRSGWIAGPFARPSGSPITAPWSVARGS